MLTINCQQCNKPKEVYPRSIKRGGGKFCSKRCADIAHTKTRNYTCLQCSNQFTPKYPRKQDFCSTTCSGLAKSTKIQKVCAACNGTFTTVPHRIAQGRGKYCSAKCKYGFVWSRYYKQCVNCKTQVIEHAGKGLCVVCRRLEKYELTASIYKDATCAICGKKEKEQDRRLAVDHDHKTGKARGLLCNTCNRAIGLLGDSTDMLEKAIKYLQQ